MGKSKKKNVSNRKTNPNAKKPIDVQQIQPIHPIQHHHELVICGHSSIPNGEFRLPINITIVFFANKDEQCIVPNTYSSLKSSISEMQAMNEVDNDGHIYSGNDMCPNHNITFTSNAMLDGILIINNDDFLKFYINPFERIFTLDEKMKLDDCCKKINKYIQQKYGPRTKFTIYCVFCRGSNPDNSHHSMSHSVISNNEQDLESFLGSVSLSNSFSFEDDNGFGLKKKYKRKPKNNKTKKKKKSKRKPN